MNDKSPACAAQLRERVNAVADIHASIAVLQWDQEVYMPPKGAVSRGMQLATLSALAHREFTAAETGRLLDACESVRGELNEADERLVAIARYDFERARKLPETFVHTFAQETSAAFGAWVQARDASDFAQFRPYLDRLVGLSREKAEYLGYTGSPYNALLEDYERGMTSEQLKVIFAELAEKQSMLVERVLASPRRADTSWPGGEWDVQAQWDFGMRVLRNLGYDLEAGRQDKSVHPFSTIFAIDDVRITTRFSTGEFFSSLTGTIHECGHALYMQGHSREDARTMLADGASLGMHESQSRMWENMIGRSLPFWKHYTPVLREHFPGRLDSVTPEQIYAALNRVHPSLVRVEADECTYNLHIILRFEIEVGLIEGTLRVDDVPAAWNAAVKRYLGLEVPDDARGCLQDIHWSHGAFAYFPTYALGNLYAAQLFEVIERDIPALWDHVASGDFAPLLAWLRSRVHRHGRRKLAPELMREIAGAVPSSEAFLTYLEQKYGALYRL
ncbi:MAG: carboxypeptidase M32 [Candidatus Hydrogenedentes bacterium]|nr:carboxypeptidase M32 [Candidatus Hydrogenedentota bacterium]